MDYTDTLESLIRQYVQIPLTSSGTGFTPVLCQVCNDHGRKGLRAGFRFDTNGIVGYHCFNCGHKAKFDPQVLAQGEASGFSKNMKAVLSAFGVPEEELQKFLFNLLKNKKSLSEIDSKITSEIKSIEPKEILLPKHFYPLQEAPPDDKWALIARDYLEAQRGITPTDYPFYLAHKTGIPQLDKWRGRLIIPIYKSGKLVYYQGRALYNHKKKYESPSSSKECVLYGFERLFEHTNMPLYVVEGFFDAFLLDGVGLLGREISDAQFEWLERSKRRKVFIPDKRGVGSKEPAEAFIKRGWEISTPDIGSCKDVNDAVSRYGKLYVLKSIIDNIANGTTARIRLGVYCEATNNKRKAKGKKTRPAKG